MDVNFSEKMPLRILQNILNILTNKRTFVYYHRFPDNEWVEKMTVTRKHNTCFSF